MTGSFMHLLVKFRSVIQGDANCFSVVLFKGHVYSNKREDFALRHVLYTFHLSYRERACCALKNVKPPMEPT